MEQNHHAEADRYKILANRQLETQLVYIVDPKVHTIVLISFGSVGS